MDQAEPEPQDFPVGQVLQVILELLARDSRDHQAARDHQEIPDFLAQLDLQEFQEHPEVSVTPGVLDSAHRVNISYVRCLHRHRYRCQ